MRLELAKRAKTNLEAWCNFVAPYEPPPVHSKFLLSKLSQVYKKIKRLMIFMPPGHAKSKYASERFPPWFMGNYPDKSIIACSHTDDLALTFGRRTRNIITSNDFYDVFKFGISGDSSSAQLWRNNCPKVHPSMRGEYKAAGVGSAIAGRRGDLGIIDDPLRGIKDASSETVREALWQWYTADFRTRLKPNAAIIIIQTRWHQDDLAGRILPGDYDGENGDIRGTDGEIWHVVCLPAVCERADDPLNRKIGDPLWPDYYSKEILEQEAAQSVKNWNSLFQQRPRPEEGLLFKVEKIGVVDALPSNIMKDVRAWDFAATSELGNSNPDWTVGLRMCRGSDNVFYISGVTRFRGEPLDVEQALLNTASLDGNDVLVDIPQDPGQAGKAQAQNFIRLLAGYVVSSSPESGDKSTRAAAFAAQISAGNVKLLRGNWNKIFIDELRDFPNGKKDDQVDAASRAFNKLCDNSGLGLLEFYAKAHEDRINRNNEERKNDEKAA